MGRALLAACLITLPTAVCAQFASAAPERPPDGVLTLRDAILAALENNLDIEIARTEPAIASEVVQESLGAFDPISSVESGFVDAETLRADIFEGTSVVKAKDWNYRAGLNGQFPLGLLYRSEWNLRRNETDSTVSVLDREWRSGWRNELTLPLLRDLVYNPANYTVKRSRVSKQISDEEFRKRLTDLILQVELAYWDLGARRADLHVAEKSVETASDLLEQTQVQYEVGVVSRVAVAQAEAGAAQREFERIVGQNLAEKAEDDLLNLTFAPDERTFERATIRTEPPKFVEREVNVDVALAKAVELRPELEAARQEVERAALDLRFAKNQRLPRLDVTASYNAISLTGKGPQTTIFGTPAGPFDLGDSGDAMHNPFNRDGANSWSILGRFEIPIGNQTARARTAQRGIELRRAHTRRRQVEQEIILDVRDAARNLRSSIEGLAAARRREAAEAESLRAEQEKLRLGDSTPFLVLEHEEDLADAEREIIGALQVHQNALAELERAQGTLLDAHRIFVPEERAR